MRNTSEINVVTMENTNVFFTKYSATVKRFMLPQINTLDYQCNKFYTSMPKGICLVQATSYTKKDWACRFNGFELWSLRQTVSKSAEAFCWIKIEFQSCTKGTFSLIIYNKNCWGIMKVLWGWFLVKRCYRRYDPYNDNVHCCMLNCLVNELCIHVQSNLYTSTPAWSRILTKLSFTNTFV